MKKNSGKKEKRLSKAERERECQFLARVLLSAQFSRPVVLLDFPPV